VFVLSCFNLLLICRADHNVQDLRAKLFPSVRKKIKATEAIPSVPLPGKRKERSLSSLGVSTTRLSAHSGLIGRRIKSAARKCLALQKSTTFVNEPFNREEDDKKVEDCLVSLSSPKPLFKFAQNRRQVKEVFIFIFFFKFYYF
jgi:E3 ubiquitin-protein ligase DRIP